MKIYRKKNMALRLAIILTIFFFFAQSAAAQMTAFNFQGRLNDGNNPANGRYDLQFKLYEFRIQRLSRIVFVTAH